MRGTGLYRETSARDRIAIHAPAYYRGLFEQGAARTRGTAPAVKLLLARHEGGLFAGNIVIFWKTMGHLPHRRLLEREAKPHADLRPAVGGHPHGPKAAGCGTYDLYGVPPARTPLTRCTACTSSRPASPRSERWGSWDALPTGSLRGVRHSRTVADVVVPQGAQASRRTARRRTRQLHGAPRREGRLPGPRSRDRRTEHPGLPGTRPCGPSSASCTPGRRRTSYPGCPQGSHRCTASRRSRASRNAGFSGLLENLAAKGLVMDLEAEDGFRTRSRRSSLGCSSTR